MPVTVVRDADGRWHRTDILACSESSVLETGDEREADPAELGGDRCSTCTWADAETTAQSESGS